MAETLDFIKVKSVLSTNECYRPLLLVSSDVCDNAEERGGPAHCQLLFLGQRDGRILHRQVGEQNHVLHRLRLRTGNINKRKEYESDLRVRIHKHGETKAS